MSNFLLDKAFSRQYEEYFSEQLGLFLNDVNGDDGGVDLYDATERIDVKCYGVPKYIKHFGGCFIETYLPKSNRAGWFLDEEKSTTKYILVADAERDRVSFWKTWIISKYDLRNAVVAATRNHDLTEKEIETAHGFIIPYKYLDEYAEEIIDGERWKTEHGE